MVNFPCAAGAALCKGLRVTSTTAPIIGLLGNACCNRFASDATVKDFRAVMLPDANAAR